MEKKLENIVAAAYLSGAAEALKKSSELTHETVTENLEDLKVLRRKFLGLAESDGYLQPVHHIEEAKQRAFHSLRESKGTMNGVSGPAPSAQSSGLLSAIEGITNSIKSFTMGYPSPSPSPSHNESHNSELLHSELPHSESLHSELLHSESLPHSELPHSELPHSESLPHSELLHSESLPTESLPPVLQLGGKTYKKKNYKKSYKKKTHHKRR